MFGRMQSPAVTAEAEKATLIFPALLVTRSGARELGVAIQMPPDMHSERQGQGWPQHVLSVAVGGSGSIRAYGGCILFMRLTEWWMCS